MPRGVIRVDRTRSCFFTGHRKIPQNRKDVIYDKVKEHIEDLICKYDVKNFISGGAIGFDMIAAKAVLELKRLYPHIQLYMFLPCRDQSKLWSRNYREQYDEILSLSDEIVYVTDGPYTDGCMKKRNLKMIENAFFCIAFCTQFNSGTGFTFRNAEMSGKHIRNVADDIYE